MTTLSRRSVLRTSLAVAGAGTLARPYIANATATTAEVWWTQGFVPEEDVAIKKIVTDYQKASGNTIDLSIMPFGPLRQKIVAALTRICSARAQTRSLRSLPGTTSWSM